MFGLSRNVRTAKASAVASVPRMNPLIWTLHSEARASAPRARSSQEPASAAQRFLESGLDGRPLVVDDAVPGGVPNAVARHHHVLPEDALERRPDAEQCVPRRVVGRVGLEFDAT